MIKRIFDRLTEGCHEKQTCPAWYPGHPGGGPDHAWTTTRWGTPFSRWVEKVHQRLSNWYQKKFKQSRSMCYGTTSWHLNWKPRSCTFCGSIHPDDAMRLVDVGWTVSVCDERTKVYLNPPDFRSPSVIPCVKFKTYHCTPGKQEEQVKKLNSALVKWPR